MKKALYILAGFLIGIALGIILLEAFLRINPKFGYIYESFKVLSSKEDATLLSPGPPIQPSSLFGYENIPNSNEANSYGLAGKSYKLEKDDKTFRILLLGDSIAWHDLSRQFLEEKLNASPMLNLKYKFEIWNAGVPSYDVRRYALYLHHKGLRHKPDMVLIFMCINDFKPTINLYYKNKNNIVCSYDSPLREVSKIYNVNPFFMKHLYVYRFAMLRIENYLSGKQKVQDIDPTEQNGTYYTEKIVEICKNNNLPLLVAIFPYLKPLSEYNNYQKYEYEIINSAVKSKVSNYINLHDHMPESDLYNLRQVKQDEIHPGPEGHVLIGDIIYNYLLDNFSFTEKQWRVNKKSF